MVSKLLNFCMLCHTLYQDKTRLFDCVQGRQDPPSHKATEGKQTNCELLKFALVKLSFFLFFISSFLIIPVKIHAANLFADNFEGGNLNAWSYNATDGGNLSVTTGSALHGSYGLSALINDTTAIYVMDNTPVADKRYRLRFYVDPNTLTMANNDSFSLIKAMDSTYAVSFYVNLSYTTAAGYRIDVLDRTDGAYNKSSGAKVITDAPHSIEVDWTASTAAGANNGTFTLWIDSVSQAVVTGIDSDTEQIDNISFGATSGIDAGTSGTLYLDDFASNNDGSQIGQIGLQFSDGFESGDLTAWSSTSIDGGDLSAATDAKIHGSYGLKCVVNDTTQLFVKDNTNAEKNYRVRFYFDPNSLAMANNDKFNLFTATQQNSPWNSAFIVELNYISSQYQLVIKDFTDGAWSKMTSFYVLTDDVHVIEVSWTASTGAGNNNGSLSLWIDGVFKETVSAIDNDTEDVGYATLGGTDIDAGTLGTFYLDDFASNNDGSEIGAYPSIPSSLTQYKSDGTTSIASSAWTNETSVTLKLSMSSANSSDSLTPQVEIQENGTTFTNSVTNSGDAVTYSGTPVTGTVTITGLTTGKTYHWQARVSNSAGQSSWISMGGNPDFGVDTSAPSGPTNLASSDHTASAWSNDNTITMTWTAATDGGSGLSGYSYVFDTTSDTTPDTTQDIALVTTITSAALTDGSSHYFHIRAVDALGNWGSAVHSGPFYIDTTAPSVSGTPSTTTPTSDTTPTWTWTASTDDGSGLHATPYTVQWCQNQNFTGCDSNTDTSSTNSCTHSAALTDGTWYFRVKAKDAVNNESSYSANGSVLIDTTHPTSLAITSITENPDSDYQYITGNTIYYNPNGSSGSFTITVSAEDSESGIQKVNFPELTGFAAINGGDDTSSLYSWTYNWTNTSTHNGPATITVTNNSGLTTTTTFNVYLDNTAPSGQTLSFGTITTDSITVSVSGDTDTEVGLNSTPYYFDRDSSQDASGWQSQSTWQASNLQPNTQYSFRVRVRDKVNNISDYTTSQSKYTLALNPTGFTANAGVDSMTLTVSSFPNDTADSSGYDFYREGDLINSGWIQTNTWSDTNLFCGHPYTFYVKYRNGNGTETNTASLTYTTDNCLRINTSFPSSFLRQPIPQTSVSEPPASRQPIPTPTPTSVPEKPISQMTIVELQARITELIAKIAELQAELAQLQIITEIPADYRFISLMKYGSESKDIKYLQVFLKSQGTVIYPEGLVTGYFGPLTKKAVTNFQLQLNIIDSSSHPAAGYVGPKTRERINEMLKP